MFQVPHLVSFTAALSLTLPLHALSKNDLPSAPNASKTSTKIAKAHTLSGAKKRPKAEYAEGELIVRYKPRVTLNTIAHSLQANRATVAKTYTALSEQSGKKTMLVSSKTPTAELMRSLRSDPSVLDVSPNYKRHKEALPNDPDFSRLWGMNNTGQIVGGTTGLTTADVDAPEAWNFNTGSQSVVVAVFDTGIDYLHEDLKDNMWKNPGELPGDGIDNDGNGYIDDYYGYNFAADDTGANGPDPRDTTGQHGTHVAGTIGAKGNNGIGVSGVNWDVSLMALNIFRPAGGAYDSDILEAIDYVLTQKQNGVNIVAVNASYGGLGGAQNDAMNSAIKTLGNAGILFAAAAGNSGMNNDLFPHFPSSYDANNIIAVAATDHTDALTYFSNYGSNSVDVAAPGYGIYSSLPGGGYTPGSGSDLFYDGFESGTLGASWYVFSGSGWSVTAEASYAGSYSLTESAGALYDVNASDYMFTNIDLSAHAGTGENVQVGFWAKSDIEEGYDYAFFCLWDDNFDNGDGTFGAWDCNVPGYDIITGTSDWKRYVFDIPDKYRTAMSAVLIAFSSDYSIVADGIHIDNFGIGIGSGLSDNYEAWSGTSMAAPFVAGAAALMAAQFPDDTVMQRKQRILSEKDHSWNLYTQMSFSGRINLNNSMNSLLASPYIDSLSQTLALKAGDLLTISGAGFGTTAGKVIFGGNLGKAVEAAVVSWSDTSITATVPPDGGRLLYAETADAKSSNTLRVTRWNEISTLGSLFDYDVAHRTLSHGSAVAVGNDIYYISGFDDRAQANIPEAKRFNTLTNTWDFLPAMAHAHAYGTAAEINGIVYIIGGVDETNTTSSSVEAYDSNLSTWLSGIAPLPMALKNPASAVIDGILYVSGGNLFGQIYNALYSYNPQSNSWTTLAPMNIGRTVHGMVAHNGKLYVFGGYNSLTLPDAEVYDPASDTWDSTIMSAPPLNIKDFNAAVMTINNAPTLLVTDDSSYYMEPNPCRPGAHVYQYDFGTDTWTLQYDNLHNKRRPVCGTAGAYVPGKGFYSFDGQLWVTSLDYGDFPWNLNQVQLLEFNNPPLALDDAAQLDEDSNITINLLANDSDVENGTLVIEAITSPVNGSIINHGDGTVSYFPDANFNGTDTFSYDVNDGVLVSTATVTMQVLPVNDAPIAYDDNATTAEDTNITLDLLANDGDIDGDFLSVLSVGTASNGIVTLNGDGSVTYTPASNVSGSDTFSYTMTDGVYNTSATVFVTVTSVADAPVAADDALTLAEDASGTVDLLANDTDADGDALSVLSVGIAAHGTVLLDLNGTATYTPQANFNGSDTFTYTVSDGLLSDIATVTVTVTALPDAPIIANDLLTLNEDTSVVIDLTANDTDADGDILTVLSVSAATHGTAALENNGSVSYTPEGDFNGTDSFQYTVSDGLFTDTGTVYVTITPVNDAPLALDDTAATTAKSAVTVNVLANDSDIDSPLLTIIAVSTAANGTVTNNTDGTLTYTPDDTFTGTDTFTYTLSDGSLSSTATVTVTVKAVSVSKSGGGGIPVNDPLSMAMTIAGFLFIGGFIARRKLETGAV